ncbi:MAG: TonB-dependent receptor [Prevotella sp.]|nr:TonB-dependent receptor [Prevotella sp.]
MKKKHYISLLIALLLWLNIPPVFAQGGVHSISISITDKTTREAIVMATIQLQPAGAMAVSNADGKAVIKNVPDGEYTLLVSYVGFEPIQTKLKVSKDLQLTFAMQPSSLALKEVRVVARQKESGASTSNYIGRQAIDHLQATSLADVMQLLPGMLMGNHDLTQAANLQLRTLVNNNTSALGSSVVVDGMPLSNNGALSAGSFSATTFAGTDLRQIPADDIDNVEVIRGIPSAEYGDLTSGLVVVHSKVGVTPYQFKAKVNPGLQNVSLGKGFNLGKAGVFNVSADYAKAWGDPRMKTRSFDRYSVNLGYGYDISRRWHTDTKVRFMQSKDWSGQDPDAQQDGTESKNKTTLIGLTHNGRIQLDKPLARSLKYTIGLNLTQTDNRNTSFVGNTSGRTDIVTAMQTGYNNVAYINGSYLATGITESRPGNVFAKISDDFFLRYGKTIQHFKVGADYHYDWNNADGYYNADESHPYHPNDGTRPRPFHDIPGLHQIAAFAEDQFTYNINKVNRLRIGAGLRLTAMQPFADVATTALSPRVNVAFSVTKWLDVRAGIGMNAKTPTLGYLYPDKKYDDHVTAAYLSQTAPESNIVNYHTHVYEVEYSKDLKNATTTKVEVGLDFKLPGNRTISLLAYRDKTPNGFGSVTEYLTYTTDVYYSQLDKDNLSGLIFTPGQPTAVNPSSPIRQDTYFITTGRIGNTNTTVNKGIEFDIDLGEVKPLRTNFYLSGAWSETKTWSTDMDSRTPSNVPTSYAKGLNLTPFKVVYPTGGDFSRYRRFVTTLRAVTHIPALNMVASLTAQAIWHNSIWTYTADKDPIGWYDRDVVYHEITPDMLNGYLGMDAMYYATAPSDQESMSISKMARVTNDNDPTKSPVTWNTSVGLTKELGRMGGLSLYVNNALFYEPFLTGNKTSTLTQRNTGTFSFGAELYLNL